MPTETDQKLLADALHRAFLVNIIAEAESHLEDEGFDSELEDNDMDSSSASSSDSSHESSLDEEMPSTSEAILNAIAELYSQ